MEISYDTRKLELKLDGLINLKRYYTNIYIKLYERLSALETAASLDLISHSPPLSRHKLKGNYEGFYAISVSKNYKIIIKPDYDNYRKIKLEQIKRIIIMAIEDYH